MDFSLSEEQRLLIGTIRRFIADELQPLEAAIEETGALARADAARISARSRDLGLYCVAAPAELGGGGLSAVDHILAEEQYGRTTDILIRRAFGNFYDVLLECQGEQVDRWLKPCISGERTASIAFTEPEAGSDAAAISTRADKANGGWRMSGHKHYVSDGGHSDFFVVTARTGEGISLFLVDKDMPGVTVGRDQPMMGLRGTSHVELSFDCVELAPVNLLGADGRGLSLALQALGRVRLAQVGARAIGRATRIMDLMTEHARTRSQFGKPIASRQMIQQMLADSAVELSSARLLLLNTAWRIDQGEDARNHISMVKVQASETLGRIADRAVQIFGGSGFAKELPIERYYRDARIFRIFDGTSEIHRSLVARALANGHQDLYDIA